MDCRNLTDPANGNVTHSSGTTFQQRATYSCNTGYNLVGDSTRTCQATGEWSGSTPTCQGTLLKGDLILSIRAYKRVTTICIWVLHTYVTDMHASIWKGLTVQAGPWVGF